MTMSMRSQRYATGILHVQDSDLSHGQPKISAKEKKEERTKHLRAQIDALRAELKEAESPTNKSVVSSGQRGQRAENATMKRYV